MAKAKRLPREVIKCDYGSFSIYTRNHINGCRRRDTNDNRCSCPKWAYVKLKDGKAMQMAVKVPSVVEASEKARDFLKGLDPEIAAARKVTEAAPGITIEACVALYEESLKRRALSKSYVGNCMRPLKRGKQCKSGKQPLNVSLLDFLDRNYLADREPVVRMEQLISDHLDRWSAEWRINDLSEHVWRGNVAAFMKWAKLHDHLKDTPEFREPHRVKPGNRCGWFNDEQIEKLRQSICFFRTKGQSLPQNYAARMEALLDCGRWVGMAPCDAVLFSPRLNLHGNIVTYRRKKTGQIATVVLDPAVAARLRSIPSEEGSDPDRPFRLPANDEERNVKIWQARFKALCEFAGVTEVEMEDGGKRDAHYYALRDSFAIGAISDGVSLDNVARMMGHKDTQMLQKAYLFWIKKRIDYCVADQQAAIARRAAQAMREPESSPKPETGKAPLLQ